MLYSKKKFILNWGSTQQCLQICQRVVWNPKENVAISLSYHSQLDLIFCLAHNWLRQWRWIGCLTISKHSFPFFFQYWTKKKGRKRKRKENERRTRKEIKQKTSCFIVRQVLRRTLNRFSITHGVNRHGIFLSLCAFFSFSHLCRLESLISFSFSEYYYSYFFFLPSSISSSKRLNAERPPQSSAAILSILFAFAVCTGRR